MTVLVDLEKLTIGDRRKVNRKKVAEIAESIEAGSLLHPITVYRPDDKVSRDGGRYHLAAGLHRVEALKSLGITTTQANVVPAERAEIVEIDENLARKDLSTLERAQSLKRRKEIFDFDGGEILPTVTGGVRIGFDSHVADKSGMSKSMARKVRYKAEQIADDVQEAIASLPAADSGVELDALASLEPDEQRQAVHRMQKFGETAREAKAFIRDDEPDEQQKGFERLRRAWNKEAGPARVQFLAWIDSQSGDTQ